MAAAMRHPKTEARACCMTAVQLHHPIALCKCSPSLLHNLLECANKEDRIDLPTHYTENNLTCPNQKMLKMRMQYRRNSAATTCQTRVATMAAAGEAPTA